ncbi:hypothetical protein HON52_04445 [Candidatus Uhrbacteria bacterium]|jgi:riboflavin kinase / FMN adenylyltransferase|nr:hypothetical protein [Candidatus Uhrbacteria bacterium]
MDISFKGKVVKGDGVAQRIFGAATANMEAAVMPDLEHGIYAAWVEHDGTRYGSSVCYGDEGGRKLEIHILDFDKDIVGHELSCEIVEKISEYVRGYSTERLRQKIIYDIGLCRELLESKNDL